MVEKKNSLKMNDTIFNRSLEKLESVSDKPFKKINHRIYLSIALNVVALLLTYWLIYRKYFDLRLLLVLLNLLFIAFLGVKLSKLNSLNEHKNLVEEVATIIIGSIPSESSNNKKVSNVSSEKIFDILEQEISNYKEDVFRLPKIVIGLSGLVTFFLKSRIFHQVFEPDFISWVIVLLALFPLILSEMYKELIKINILKEAIRVAQFEAYTRHDSEDKSVNILTTTLQNIWVYIQNQCSRINSNKDESKTPKS
ncbi:hypothetical protein [Oenococcus sp.]|uniref:hypothetical protein n=1 Tax=Oenococcus sp. TaxID=1979414 RepID=UPI0039E7AC68